jgi:hypothetical protein
MMIAANDSTTASPSVADFLGTSTSTAAAPPPPPPPSPPLPSADPLAASDPPATAGLDTASATSAPVALSAPTSPLQPAIADTQHGRESIDWQKANDEILAGLNLAQEFSALGIELTANNLAPDDGWVECWAWSRPHGDSPSAAVNVRTGWYRDLGGTGQKLSFWDLLVALGKFTDWKSARDAYAKKVGKPIGKARTPADSLTFRPWNQSLVAQWCGLHKQGITPEAVLLAGGRLATYHFCGDWTVIALPMFGENLTAADPVGWVLYEVGGRKLPIGWDVNGGLKGQRLGG